MSQSHITKALEICLGLVLIFLSFSLLTQLDDPEFSRGTVTFWIVLINYLSLLCTAIHIIAVAKNMRLSRISIYAIIGVILLQAFILFAAIGYCSGCESEHPYYTASIYIEKSLSIIAIGIFVAITELIRKRRNALAGNSGAADVCALADLWHSD